MNTCCAANVLRRRLTRFVACLPTRSAVVYDDLASEDILSLAPPGAERVYMGKRGGGGAASSPQAAIDARLVALALAGRRVVRLKGGCPSVFSRVASEARALANAGVPFELVPGVSSALAAPLLAGFPLTDAVLGRTFAVATAHELRALDFSALAAVDTAVLLMGAKALAAIADGLVAAGKPAGTPVAVVRWAGTPQQRVWEGTLESIAAVTAGEALSPGPFAAHTYPRANCFLALTLLPIVASFSLSTAVTPQRLWWWARWCGCVVSGALALTMLRAVLLTADSAQRQYTDSNAGACRSRRMLRTLVATRTWLLISDEHNNTVWHDSAHGLISMLSSSRTLPKRAATTMTPGASSAASGARLSCDTTST
jgi:uroporphyrinogen III methyltransferase/synthase